MPESTKTRMAGSDEFKEELSNAARNKQIREEIGNNPDRLTTRLESVDRDAYDFTGFSDKEINMAFQGGEFGDEDYARLTGKSIGSDDDDKGGNNPNPSPTPTPTPIPTPTPTPTLPNPIPGPGPSPIIPMPEPGRGMFDGQQQQVIQDNDIVSNVTGNNNTVTNTQDNSISQSMGSSDYSTRYARGLKDKYILNLINR